MNNYMEYEKLIKLRAHRCWYRFMRRYSRESNQMFNERNKTSLEICEEWYNFNNFYQWCLDNGWDENSCLSRKISYKGFSPDNCCICTRAESFKNSKRGYQYTLNGETHTLRDWCKIKNLNYESIYTRVHKLNWSVEKALTFPIKFYDGTARERHKQEVKERQLERFKERLKDLNKNFKK